MTEKLFKMGISRTKKTGIILERELSTDEVFNELVYCVNKNKHLKNENEELKQLIKKVLETTPIEHTLAVELKNSVRELYD